MKKIGFIDHCIDEWHANNYPRMIRESSRKGMFDVALAWDEARKEGKKSIDEWCRELGVARARSIEQVVAECDCIVVLSPDNPEEHERLADLPLRSGKPVCIDKPFAPTLVVAKRLFAQAEEYSTPMMSSSALRFGSALEGALGNELAGQKANFAAIQGAGIFQVYAVHQLEMLVMLMGPGARRVMQYSLPDGQLMLVDYGAGRMGTVNLLPRHPFRCSAQYGPGKSLAINEMADFFPRFIEAMLAFFDTGQSPVPKQETLEVAALLEAGASALAMPGEWVDVGVI